MVYPGSGGYRSERNSAEKGVEVKIAAIEAIKDNWVTMRWYNKVCCIIFFPILVLFLPLYALTHPESIIQQPDKDAEDDKAHHGGNTI